MAELDEFLDDEVSDSPNLDNLIEKKLLQQRIIYFTTTIDEKTIRSLIMKIHILQRINHDPITIYLNTPGGSVYHAIALYDVCKNSKVEISVIGQGIVMSAGTLVIACCGSKGKRLAMKNTSFMIHQVSTMSIGKLNDIEVDYEETKRVQEIYERLILKNTKITKKQLKELLKKDYYFNAEEALKYGFIDEII